MDYKYIEQLLERYWQCETSLPEEAILREFFLREDVPQGLLQYRDLFLYQHIQQKNTPGEDFDRKVLSMVETPVVKTKKLTIISRFYPLFRAVAMVAVVVMTANAVRQLSSGTVFDYNYDEYTDTYTDPEVAYETISSALMMLSECLNKTEDMQLPDSIQVSGVGKRNNQ